MPLLLEDEAAYNYSNTQLVENDFYASLYLLASQHTLQLEQTRHFDYPYNIAMGLANLHEQLKSKVKDWQELYLIHHQDSTFFAHEVRYKTGSTLFYIPIVPLFMMLKDPKRKDAARLLLSVCCYLYRIADIPYYRQEGSYLYYMYDMLSEWMEEENEEQDSELMIAQRHATYVGDRMEQKLRNPANLKFFEFRLKHFKCADKFDQQCAQVARAAFQLYQQYPTSAIDRNFQYNTEMDDEGEYYSVSLDKYVSFYATGKGVLTSCLFDNINVDLQEYASTDEPVIYEPIDGRAIEGNNFDFEKALFTLLGDVATVLYTFEQKDYEKHNQ